MTDIVYWIRGNEHRDMAILSIHSARRVYKHCRVFIYTDDPDLAKVSGAHMHYLAPGRPAMVANLDAQVTHLMTGQPSDRVLFLDADTLVRKAFPFGTADLYPTWRDNVGIKGGKPVEGIAKLMPYNYGVLGAIVSPATVEAFLWLRARILQMTPAHRDWYGNQFALADLCGGIRGAERVRIPWTIDDATGTELSIARLPCNTWNYTPEAANEDVSDKGILHFKGGRKDMMEAYQ